MPQQRPMATGMPPQQTGYLGSQPTGMGMGMNPTGLMPQQTGMGMGMNSAAGLGAMRQPGLPQQPMGPQPRYLSPNPLQMQPTGMMQQSSPRPPPGIQPQMTGYPGGMMGMQPTGLAPQMTGMPLDPRMQLMSAQFLPAAQPFQGGTPLASNMNFSNASMQPASFQGSIQNLSQQQQGSKEPKIPWALSKDERKSYDSIFRAWDQKGTGFLSGDVAQEVFGQSGLDRDKLMQIWHLSDTENRGKLNLAEFHVAMGLIYRALNGNDIPEHLPPELIPPSARDLSDSVDFLKDLLKRDANVRHTTGLNIPEAGSNKNTAYGKSTSFHENPIQKQDAAAYKHTDEQNTGYRSSARHLDRRAIRYGGESPAEDLSEMKRQLAHTQRMLDSHAEKDDDDREVEKEMEELRFRIKRVQDDIEYYNRRGGRDAAENRRKAERELLHLMHERLPLLEKRLEEKDKKSREKKLDQSRDRDRRNDGFLRSDRYSDGYSTPTRGYSDYSRETDSSRRATPTFSKESPHQSAASPSPTSPRVSGQPVKSPPPASAAATPATSGPPKDMSAEEKQAWLRSEAQRRIEERKRALGISAPVSSQSTSDQTVENRLAAEKAEAAARSAQADAETTAREDARRARLEQQRIEKEKEAVKTIKSELKDQEKSDATVPAPVIQAAREEVDEQEEMLRRREEVLKREKEEREARFKKLEEEEENSRRQEQLFQERQAQFQKQSSNLPAPSRKSKVGPPPPPPSRSKGPSNANKVAPVPPTPAPAPELAPVAPPAPPASESASVHTAAQERDLSAEQVTSTAPQQGTATSPSTNPFHRMQSNGSVATPGGTNPFFKQQQKDTPQSAPSNFDISLPAPQRPTSSPVVSASAPPVPRGAPADDDDDWGESEHGDHDEDDPDGPGTTSRAHRQNLAAALFSNIVPTPPQSSSPAPPLTDSSAPPAPAPPAPAPPAPAPPAPAAPSMAPSGPVDRGALLGQIRGGLSLRKSQTNDRSAANVTGKVIGDASAPVQKFVPPPSPPAEEETHFSGDNSSLVTNPNRQSVDWANSLAADQMHEQQKVSAIPDEPSVREEAEESGDENEEPEHFDTPRQYSVEQERQAQTPVTEQDGADGSAVPVIDTVDQLQDFDLTKALRVRTLYPYEAQRDEDLGFSDNVVILANPAKDVANDWWYGTLLTGASGQKGTFPRTYVQEITHLKKAKALYDFEGASNEEMTFSADQLLDVVDDQDQDWLKVLDDQERILMVPATYVEILSSG